MWLFQRHTPRAACIELLYPEWSDQHRQGLQRRERQSLQTEADGRLSSRQLKHYARHSAAGKRVSETARLALTSGESPSRDTVTLTVMTQ